MGLFEREDPENPSKIHFWAAALTGGSTVPISWIVSGSKAGIQAIKGAFVGCLFGLDILSRKDDGRTCSCT